MDTHTLTVPVHLLPALRTGYNYSASIEMAKDDPDFAAELGFTEEAARRVDALLKSDPPPGLPLVLELDEPAWNALQAGWGVGSQMDETDGLISDAVWGEVEALLGQSESATREP